MYVEKELRESIEKTQRNSLSKQLLLNQIIVLRPLYKKFFIYRGVLQSKKTSWDELCSNNYSQQLRNVTMSQTVQSPLKLLNSMSFKKKQSEKIKFSDNRKILSLRIDDSETTIKFDYIISLYNNKYEEPRYSVEENFCNGQIINILLTYSENIISREKPQDIFVLYLNNSNQTKLENISNLKNFKDKNNCGTLTHQERPFFFQILEEFFNEIGTRQKWVYSCKSIYHNSSSQEILQETEVSDKNDNFISVKSINYSKSLGQFFTLRHPKSGSKMKFLNIDYSQGNNLHLTTTTRKARRKWKYRLYKLSSFKIK